MTHTLNVNIRVARDHFQAAVLDGKLYVVGGRDSTSSMPQFFDDVEPSVDVYDFSTKKWSSLPDFPRPRGGTATTVFNGTVVVAAGEGFGRAWTEVDALQNNGTFTALPDMISPAHGTGIVGCRSALWIVAGSRIQGGGETNDQSYAFYEGSSPLACSQQDSAASPVPSTVPATTVPATTVSTITNVATTTTTTTTISSTSTTSTNDGTSAIQSVVT